MCASHAMYPVNRFRAQPCPVRGGGVAPNIVKDTQLRVTITLLRRTWGYAAAYLYPQLSRRSNWPVPMFDDMQATWSFTQRERDMAPVFRYILRWSR